MGIALLFRNTCIRILTLLIFIVVSSSYSYGAVPPNDGCASATPITISNGGFGLGVFTGTNTDLTDATLQAGETFAPSIIVAGLNKKSVWYKFTLPTNRSARISLAQPGSGIQAGNVGFAVYKTNTCLPGNTEISTKFSPIEIFGSSFHPCVDAGDYLVQVTGNLNANGPIFITVDVGEPSPALYDKPADPFQFTNINTNKITTTDFLVECQTIDDASENCQPNGSFKDFTKSTWHTFTTPNYFDWFSVLLTSMEAYGLPDYTVGYRIYEGDSRTTPIASLLPLGGCDSMKMNGYYPEKKIYKCGALKPNTTYTLQLLYHKDFIKTMRLGVAWNGVGPTKGPEPISSLPSPNNMGTLPADGVGINTTVSDNLSCNSRHSQHNCPNSMPVAGVKNPANGSMPYTLSSFISFKLATTSSLNFSENGGACYSLLMRLYKQDLTNNCADLDTANIIAVFTSPSGNLRCLDPGNYVLQVMGIDSSTAKESIHWSTLSTTPYPMCIAYNLGNTFNVTINAKTEVATNKYSLSAPGNYEKINNLQPLVNGINYISLTDTFGCAHTVLPDTGLCTVNNLKGAYREFVMADSAMVSFTDNWYSERQGKLYKGDANDLAIAQNKFAYPQKISGLVPYSNCIQSNSEGNNTACVIPGTYTLGTFEFWQGRTTQLTITPRTTETKHATPATAQDMGDLWSYVTPGTFYRSDRDTFTCRDNPATIDGIAPCLFNGYQTKKQIYRQFYLSKPTSLTIANYNYQGNDNYGYGNFTLFKGKATDGIASLQSLGTKWTCFTNAANSGQCDVMPEGWYTVVSYGYGPSYSNPLENMPATYQNSLIGLPNFFYVILGNACASPQFNRPSKASVDTVTKKPYLVEWGPQTGHTAAYPVTSKKYTLNRENFDCTQDTIFIKQNMKSCAAENVKLAFYVFEITRESYIQIDGVTDALWSAVYAFDVRTADSSRMKTEDPLQTCLNKKGAIEFCKLQPGTYTLVFYGRSSEYCTAITPTIYVDQVGVSRFDHANTAYDFGAIKPDSTWYNGNPGDANPLDADRSPSNDFFYCTTGAQPKDPDLASCMSLYNPNIYNTGNNVVLHPDNTTSPDQYTIDRRNLWYTFTINHAGNVKVRVKNKTLGKQGNNYGYTVHQSPFAVYKTDEDGTIPFNQLVANGNVDSTLAQGLNYVTRNHSGGGYYYCNGTEEISFYVEPCTFKPTRYYIIVENRNAYGYDDPHAMNPNNQIEVELLFDSVGANPPKFDHFSQANDMGLVNSGIKKGDVDNFTCATKDLPDPLYSYTTCQKTLWYKFTTTTTGQIRYAAFFKNTNNYYYDHIQLFRQIKPNDSSSTGLQHMPLTTINFNDGYWAQQCISPGTYYIILPGCNALNEDVYPQIEIIPQAGDFCSFPMVASLSGAGSSIVPVTVDCHTIGTDYGEFNPTLTCPANAVTSNYKSSWYRLDITGTDTLDVTVFINEKTNAGSTDIKYRMMTGSCGAMQEQSCVQDALTRNTYKCLAPGNSYFIQVFSPTLLNSYTPVTGDIDLNISAVVHADTCLPASTCIGVANFTPQFDCTKDKDVVFTNFSTYGSSIKYEWDFGYNNEKSNAVSPRFFYPALTTDQTYTVKLVLTNTICGKKDSATQTITIPARPSVNLGNDTAICTSVATVLLDATSHTGSTYYWYNGSTQPTMTVSGVVSPYVEVTYNGCKVRDTINIFINPIAKRALQTRALCAVTQVTLDAYRGQGEQYQWSTGAASSSIIVSQPGYYWVDLYLRGCIIRDSFQVVSTSLRPLGNDTTICQVTLPYIANATVSGATSYTWQNNSTGSSISITQPGTYWVDISLGGCTFRDSLTIAVDSFKTAITSARICQGQNYILPSGTIITTSGIYRDSLKNSSGCTSLITILTLTVDTVKKLNTNVFICAGQSYTLPSGKIVTTAGSYADTVKNTRGCDSLVTNLSLSIAVVSRISKNAAICIGNTYTMPSGKIISATGVYTDTLKAGAGCDSLITTVDLLVLSPTTTTSTANICTGNTYTLPSGNTVNVSGVYRDTLRHVNGCDSLIRIVTLTVTAKPNLGADKSASTCFGNTVNLSSIYNTAGLSTNWSLNGATVTNPAAVDIAGIYQLVAVNAGGCSDTALVTVTVNANLNLGPDKSANICPGTTIDLTAQFATSGSSSNWTRAGVPVINPALVTTAGIYQLVADLSSGCSDTALFTIIVSPQPVLGADKVIAICPGFTTDLSTLYNTSGFTSDWSLGSVAVTNPSVINTAGSYRLIASNIAGCSDTAIVTVTINPKPNLGADKVANFCAGNTLDLTAQFNTTGLSTSWTVGGSPLSTPSNITTAGIYQLTAAAATGCLDTAYITLSVDPKPVLGPDKSIDLCPGNRVNLTSQFVTTGLTPTWTLGGNTVANLVSVTVAGTYQLIVAAATGCRDTALFTITNNPKPAIGADKSILTCAGNPIDLSILYPTTGLTTAWSLNGITVTNPAAVSTTGIYQLVVSNIAGCQDTAFVTLSIDPKPNIGIDRSVTVCAGTPVDLTSQFTTTGLVTNWTIGGAPVPAPGAIITGGVYRVIVTNSTGCSDTAFVNIVANPRPSLGADKAVSACLGNSVDLTKEFVTTGLTAVWTMGGAPVANPALITTAGVYRLIVTNSFACADTAAITVTFNQPPTVLVTNPVAVCAPATANLTSGAITSGSTTGLVYTYWKDAAATVSHNNATATPGGLYFIKGTDPNGCFITKPVTVSMYALPIVSAGRDTSICDQTYAILNGNATNLSGGTVSYLWSPATGLGSATSATTIARPATTVTYTLTATVDYGPCSVSVKDDIRVTMQPPVQAFAGNDTNAVAGVPHQLKATGGVNYLWSPSTTLNNPSVDNPLATLQKDTRFTVRVTDIAGCEATASVLVKVYDNITYYLPKAFSPNGDGLNDIFRPIPSGIVSTDWFRIFSRYGVLVFETSQMNKGWDGIFKGVRQPVGNYVWSIKGKGRDGKVVELKGNVILVR